MSDYTPTTEEVLPPLNEEVIKELALLGLDQMVEVDDEKAEQFLAHVDRWLAEVKAQTISQFIDETGVSLDAARSLMAKAWEEGYAAGDADAHTKDRLDRHNPYINGETK